MMIEINRKLRRVADRLVRTMDCFDLIRVSGVRYTVLSSDEQKIKDRRIIFGMCEKIPEKYKWKIPYDFVIYVYEPNCEGFTDKQYEILLEHELRHIGVDISRDEPSYYIVPHDIEEFYPILDSYGRDWQVKTDG